jgi:hypothetical protein
MKRLFDDYGSITEEGLEVSQDAKHMFEPIKRYIETVYNQYPMKELEELLNIELTISCTIARQRAKMLCLIKNKDDPTM